MIGVSVRWVTIDGRWKEVLTTIRRDGSSHTTTKFSGTDGQYIHDDTKGLQFVNKAEPPEPPEFHSTRFLRERRGFVRESSVLGLKTFVFRVTLDDKHYFEKDYSPELGIIPLKLVFHDDDAGDTITEAIHVEFGDVSNEIVMRPAKIRVKLELIQQRINDAEASGKHDLANALRSAMKDWREMNHTNDQ